MIVLGMVILTSLAFDFTNGFHDTANAMATSIATGALKPKSAVALSAVLNLVGAFLSVQVALTVTNSVIRIQDSTGAPNAALTANGGSALLLIVLAGLVGAILWNLLTWLLGLPSSSSHALFGGLIGATIAASGTGALNVDGIVGKVLVPLVVSPVLGIAIGFALMVVLLNLFRRSHPRQINERFRRLQLLSAAYMAFAHGSNDAQKTMGIMTLALVSAGILSKPVVPLWIIFLAASAISLGTAAGGWRIIRTMGQRVVKLDPVHGFAAETTAATIILGASQFGIPVSTTHVISTAIMGVGASDRFSAVRWGVAGDIFIAWILTLPASGAVAWIAWQALSRVL